MIACMFLIGEPAAWFERAVQPHIYKWNKFKSSLEKNFRSFGADWERRMIKEFKNSTEDSSEDGFGWYEGTCPSNTPDRDDGDDIDDSSDDGDDEDDPNEDLEEESDETETQEKGVVCEG